MAEEKLTAATRLEKILDNIAGGDNEITPATRLEKFLSYIADAMEGGGGSGGGLPTIVEGDEGKVLYVNNEGQPVWSVFPRVFLMKKIPENEFYGTGIFANITENELHATSGYYLDNSSDANVTDIIRLTRDQDDELDLILLDEVIKLKGASDEFSSEEIRNVLLSDNYRFYNCYQDDTGDPVYYNNNYFILEFEIS